MKNLRLTLLLGLFAYTGTAQNGNLRQVLVQQYDMTTQAYVPADSIDYYCDTSRVAFLPNRMFYRKNIDIRSRRTFADVPITIDFSRFSGPHMQHDLGFHYDSAILYRRNASPAFVQARSYQSFAASPAWVKEYELKANPYNNVSSGYNTYSHRVNFYSNPVKVYRDFVRNGDTFTYKHIAGTGIPDTLFVHSQNTQMNWFVKFHNAGNQVVGEDEYFPIINRRIAYIYTYTQTNKPSTATRIRYTPANATVGDTLDKRVFLYDANDNMIEEQLSQKDMHGNIGWRVLYKIKMAYNSKNLRTSDTVYYDYYIHGQNQPPYYTQGLVKRARRQYQYNARDLVTQYQVDYWYDSSQTWAGGFDSLFGYAHKVNVIYGQPTSVAHTVQSNTQMELYPVPASDELTVKAQLPSSTDFTVTIYNINGIVNKEWQEKGANKYTKTISTADMPPGTYILKLSNDAMSETRRFVIVR